MDINEQIAENAGLIYKQLSSFNMLFDQDAESFAYEALYRAITTYNSNAGTAFSTYAVCCINNALRKHLRTLNRKRQLDVVSCFEPISASEDSDCLIDTLVHPDDAESVVLFRELTGVVREALIKVLSNSTPMHRKIIQLWYESDCNMPQREIAEALSITQPTVSKAISIFKHKIKLELEEYL